MTAATSCDVGSLPATLTALAGVGPARAARRAPGRQSAPSSSVARRCVERASKPAAPPRSAAGGAAPTIVGRGTGAGAGAGGGVGAGVGASVGALPRRGVRLLAVRGHEQVDGRRQDWRLGVGRQAHHRGDARRRRLLERHRLGQQLARVGQSRRASARLRRFTVSSALVEPLLEVERASSAPWPAASARRAPRPAASRLEESSSTSVTSVAFASASARTFSSSSASASYAFTAPSPASALSTDEANLAVLRPALGGRGRELRLEAVGALLVRGHVAVERGLGGRRLPMPPPAPARCA